MANLSAALNSLASTTVVDFYRARAKHVSDSAALKLARLATIAWGGVLLTIAIWARHSKSVLEAGLTIGSIPMGALLGVFLLGVLTRKPREGAAIAGVASGLAHRSRDPLLHADRVDLVRVDRDRHHFRSGPRGLALPGCRRPRQPFKPSPRNNLPNGKDTPHGIEARPGTVGRGVDRSRHRHRQRYFSGAEDHDPKGRQRGSGLRRVGGGRTALAGGRPELCRAGRRAAGGRRRIRIPARGVRAAVGISL